MNKPKAIVLGGTIPHKALIENLKQRGYYVILLDYYENPPAKEAADRHIQESTLDKDKVLEVARREKVELVISTCIDQANVTACYVGEKLGLPIPYNYQTALDISDKSSMKTMMRQGGIPTSNFIHVGKETSLNLKELKFPLVVKPSDSNGSKGVRRVDSTGEFDQYLADAITISRNNKAIVEEFVEGPEIGVDCFVADHHAHILALHRKRKPQKKDGSVMFSIGSISPPGLSENAKQNIQRIANKVAAVFRLNNTPLLIQLIVHGDHASVVEFAPRIGGGLNFHKINLFAGFDIIDAAIDSFLGVEVTPVYKLHDYYYSENHIYTEPGVFGKICGYEELFAKEVLVAFFPNKTRGMVIHPGKASKDRAASFIVKGETKNEIISKVQQTLDTVKVFDINGNEMAFLHNYRYSSLLF